MQAKQKHPSDRLGPYFAEELQNVPMLPGSSGVV